LQEFYQAELSVSGYWKILACVLKGKPHEVISARLQGKTRAVNFYLRESFMVSKEQTDENTGEIELAMNWAK